MAQIKGTAIRGALKFVKQSGHPGGIPAVLAELPPAEKAVFQSRILTASWYPYEVYAALLAVVDRRLGRGDLTLMKELGRHAVRQDAGTVLKIISIFTSVEAVHARGAMFWSRYCDTGELQVIESSPNRVVDALVGFPGIAPQHCELTTGWVEGLALAVGAKTATVRQTRCVHRGAERCELEGTWS
jgi:predicted hydrocarbon binding protein